MLKIASLLLLSVQFCVTKNILYYRSNETQSSSRKQPGFLLSMPKTLVSGRNETVCLSLHQVHAPAKILIDLKFKDKHYRTMQDINSESSCFKMKVPAKRIGEPQFVGAKVQVQINGRVYAAHNQDPILLYPSQSNTVLIETDRGIYKPGDTIKFLVLQLNGDLLPVSRKVADIHIKNPLGITVVVWENLHLKNGLLSLSYQTPPGAMIGKWKLQVENHTTRTFEVAKYALPRFKIELKYPRLIYHKADFVTVSVCGRYSHNRPVPGLAFIKVSHNFGHFEAFNKLGEMVNGCSEFKIDRTELGLDSVTEDNHEIKHYVHITATVTEYGANKMDAATGKSKIVLRGYSVQFSGDTMFTPGLPYKGQVKIRHPLVDVEHEVVEICYTIAIKKSWNYFNNEQCQQYKVSKEGVVDFQLWPFKSSVLHVHLHAKSMNNSLITDESLLVRLFTPSSSFVQVRKETPHTDSCNTRYQYTVSYASDNFAEGQKVNFFYTVKSPKHMVTMGVHEHTVTKRPSTLNESHFLGPPHKFVKTDALTDQFTLIFDLNAKFATQIQVLVYYVTSTGETVASTLVEDVEPCTFQVTSEWIRNRVLPGSVATLDLKSQGSGLCAVSATDKAVRFMTGNNRDVMSLDRVLKVFSPERESARSGRNSCLSVNNKKGQSAVKNEGVDSPGASSRRSKRHIFSFSEDFDAYDVFSNFGIVTVTNLQVITKPCYSGPLVNDSYQVQFLTDQYETSTDDDHPQPAVRSYFPETWLWELVPVADSVQLQRTVPHSITNWLTSVFCVSDTHGVGFAKDIELEAFQSFFVEVLTPYSIKKGENFNLMVHVSNYANYSFPIKVSIRISDNLKLTHEMSSIYCLGANNTQTHNYPITGVEIGAANVTVLVESDAQYPQPCGPETVVSKRDVVFKSFLVEPEGYYMANTKSVLLCASKPHFESNVTWNLRIPRDVVEGTERGVLSVNGDILGQSIENLHQLLTIPTGCGEQIMASMAPNLYVLQYLNATGGLSSVIKQRITRNLKLGYQRILNYAHSDGSFSAFGRYDPAGSMFLTTFVVKVLQEAKSLIYVDQRVIERAVAWIFQHQLENGCFDTMYHVFQDMGGTSMENSTAGLTSYVILSLFDAKVDVPDSVQTNAKYCIRGQNNPDTYSVVISSYALFKVHWMTEARKFLEKAFAVVHREDGLMWWSTKGNDESLASDVEVTSYALLALMEQRTAENMAYAHSIAQWLVSKMTATGAFQSTQDTIVALDALTKYANHIHSDDLSLNIKVDTRNETHIFAIERRDRLKSKEITLTHLDGQVSINLEGTGCVLAQLTLSHHTTILSESDSFKLALEVAAVSNVDQCSIKSISPCVAYEGPEEVSSMAVMELVLPSGFQADRASLYALLEQERTNIKMFEEKDDQINIYFTDLGRSQVCFSFYINENLAVHNRKRSVVKLYSYYRPEQSLLQFYQVINNCSTGSIEGLQDTAGSYRPKAEALIDSKLLPEKVPQCVSLGRNHPGSPTGVYRKDLDPQQINLLGNSVQELPFCVHLPLSRLRSKREAHNSTASMTCTDVKFHELFQRPKTKRSTGNLTWFRYKRDSGNSTQSFVDLDVDMETPDCINVPFYTPFPTQENGTHFGTNNNRQVPAS